MKIAIIGILALCSVCSVMWSAVPEDVKNRNAGVFIGVNDLEYVKEKPLKYAVNDAVAMAHVWSIQLGMIDPKKVTLVIAGQPTEKFRQQFEDLKRSGATVKDAVTGSDMADAIDLSIRTVDTMGLMIVSVSAHGTELRTEGGSDYYIMASKSRSDNPGTMLRFKDVNSVISGYDKIKKVVFTDTCRTMAPSRGGKSVINVYRQSFDKVSGQLVVKACDVGQETYERDSIEMGVFTWGLIKAIGGSGDTGVNTHIRIGDIVTRARVICEEAEKKMSSTGGYSKGMVQVEGDDVVRDIPLVASRAYLEQKSNKDYARRLLSNAKSKFENEFSIDDYNWFSYALEVNSGDDLTKLMEVIKDMYEVPTEHSVRTGAKYAESKGILSIARQMASLNQSRPSDTRMRSHVDGIQKIVVVPCGGPKGVTPSTARVFDAWLRDKIRKMYRGIEVRVAEKNANEVVKIFDEYDANGVIMVSLQSSVENKSSTGGLEVIRRGVTLNVEMAGIVNGMMVVEEEQITGSASEFGSVAGDTELEAMKDAMNKYLEIGGRWDRVGMSVMTIGKE